MRPRSMSFSVLSESRKRARTMPSVRFMSKPPGQSAEGGYTSTSFAVKSVSTEVEETQSFTSISPVTSVSCARGSV